MTRSLNNKIALITGAGSGIGREIAVLFASQGAHVILSDINDEGMQETGRRIKQAGGEYETHVADVSKRSDMKKLAAEVQRQHGSLDVLVNNAGIASAGRFIDTSLDTWDKVIDINLKGVVHGCHYFIPDMIKKGCGGHVINLSSMAGYVAPREMSIYAASKFAVLGFSESLRGEMAEHDIHVAAICPGIINTPIIANTVMEGEVSDAGLREKAMAFYQKRNYPPQKVAQAVLKAVLKKQSVVPVSPEAWLGYYGKRLFPGVLERIGRLENPLAKE